MESQVIFLASILVLGIAAQWIAWRFRLPSILVLLAFGFCGGWLADQQFVNLGDSHELIPDELLFPIVALSVAVILFEGGLTLRVRELREAGGSVFRMVTVGVLITWVLGSASAYYFLGLEINIAVLLGAILVVSGPTVIVPLLRHVQPTKRIGSVIKWEGIVNDPIGAVLAVLVLKAILAGGFSGSHTGDTLLALLTTIVVGTVMAAVAAFFLLLLMRRYLVPDYLHNAVFLAVVIVAYTASNHMRAESGLVTVTMLGIFLANQKSVQIKHIIEFKENLRILLLSALFILLSSRVKISDLQTVGWNGFLFIVSLILLVRPITVFVSLLGSALPYKERIFLAWMAPRGIVAAAVSALFALEITGSSGAVPLSDQLLQDAHALVPITFLVIVSTVSVYGLTAAPLARWLGLSQQNPQGILFVGAAPWVREMAAAINKEGLPVLLVDTNYRNISTARQAGLSTCYASILSEYVMEEQDLGGIGRIVAMTPNDEVNSLATKEFSEQFGRSEVYQLPIPEVNSDRHTPSAETRLSRSLFRKDATYAWLAQQFKQGAQVKTTRITEDFTFQDFTEMHGPDALVLFVLTTGGKLNIATVEDPLTPTEGQAVIALVDPLVAEQNKHPQANKEIA